MDNFVAKFRDKISLKRGKQKDKNDKNNGSRNAYNNNGGNSKKNGKNGKQKKPRFNKEKGGLLCYDYNKYGYIAKNCPNPKKKKTSGGNNNKNENSLYVVNKPIPGLKDYNGKGHNMAAIISNDEI